QIDLLAGYAPTFRSGDALPGEGVFSVSLRPREEVIYPVTPEERHDGGYGGIVTIVNLSAGRYRISHSAAARVDAVQFYRLVPSTTFADSPWCPEYRSVEVRVQDGPLTLQIDDARTPRL